MGFCYPADNRTNVRELGFIRRQGIVVCSIGQFHLLLRHAVHLCMKSYINMWPSAQMNSSVRMNPVCCLAIVIKSTSQRTSLGSIQMMRSPSQLSVLWQTIEPMFVSWVSSASGKEFLCAALANSTYYYGMRYICV